MKWKLISHPASAVHVFNLVESNTVKEILRYNPLQQSARISCRGEQRLFFIEKAGFSSSRFLFRNEYGFVIGTLLIENLNAEGGTIELEDRKFHYRLHTNPELELVIYEYDMVQPMLSCSFINDIDGGYLISGEDKKTIHEYSSLLLGLSWYLFNTPVKEDNKVARIGLHAI